MIKLSIENLLDITNEVSENMDLWQLGEYKRIGELFKGLTEYILENENCKRFTVEIDANSWATYKKGNRIQYGGKMISGVVSSRNSLTQASSYYKVFECFTSLDNKKHQVVLPCGKHIYDKVLSIREKLVSILIEEIAHALTHPYFKAHGKEFLEKYLYVYNKYYNFLIQEFTKEEETINNLRKGK